MQNSCLFCEKQQKDGQLNFAKLLNRALYLKYTAHEDQGINDLIHSKKKKWIIQFHEQLYEADEQYFKRIYNGNEVEHKLEDLIDYYKFRIDTPRIFTDQFKIMFKYTQIKRAMHYDSVKKMMGYYPIQNNVKTEVPQQEFNILDQITFRRDDVSKSLLEIIKQLEPKPQQKLKEEFLSRLQSFNQLKVRVLKNNTKLYTVPSSLKSPTQAQESKFSQYKLKTLLLTESPKKSFNRRISQTTQGSNNKSQTMKKSVTPFKSQAPAKQVIKKQASQPDLISNIYLRKPRLKLKK